MSENLELILTRYGRMIVPINDYYVGKSLLVYKEYSQHECEFLHYLSEDKKVLEIGSNIGAITIGGFSKAKQVVAVEPHPLLFSILSANTVLTSNVGKIILINKAVGQQDSITFPYIDISKVGNYGATTSSNEGYTMPCVSLQSLCEVYKPDIIKIDAEGAEHDILCSGITHLKTHFPTLYFENDREAHYDKLIELMDNLGYLMGYHYPSLYNENNFACYKTNLYPGIASLNIIAEPKIVKNPKYKVRECKDCGKEYIIGYRGLENLLCPYHKHIALQ